MATRRPAPRVASSAIRFQRAAVRRDTQARAHEACAPPAGARHAPVMTARRSTSSVRSSASVGARASRKSPRSPMPALSSTRPGAPNLGEGGRDRAGGRDGEAERQREGEPSVCVVRDARGAGCAKRQKPALAAALAAASQAAAARARLPHAAARAHLAWCSLNARAMALLSHTSAAMTSTSTPPLLPCCRSSSSRCRAGVAAGARWGWARRAAGGMHAFASCPALAPAS